jgi:hypothetical protein
LVQTDAGQNVTALGQFNDACTMISIVVVFTMDNLQLLQRISKEVTVMASLASSGRKLMNAGFLNSCRMGAGGACNELQLDTAASRKNASATTSSRRISIEFRFLSVPSARF